MGIIIPFAELPKKFVRWRSCIIWSPSIVGFPIWSAITIINAIDVGKYLPCGCCFFKSFFRPAKPLVLSTPNLWYFLVVSSPMLFGTTASCWIWSDPNFALWIFKQSRSKFCLLDMIRSSLFCFISLGMYFFFCWIFHRQLKLVEISHPMLYPDFADMYNPVSYVTLARFQGPAER